MGPGWLKAYNFSTQFALPELETPRLSALQRCRWPRLRDCKWEGTWLSAGQASSGPATGAWMLYGHMESRDYSFSISYIWSPSMRLDGRSLTWSALAILLRATSWINSSCRITWTLQPRSNDRLGHKWVNKEMEICPLHTITGTRQLILSLLHLLQSAYSSDRKIYGGLFINKVVLKAYQDEAGSRTPYWPVILHYSLRPKIHSRQ